MTALVKISNQRLQEVDRELNSSVVTSLTAGLGGTDLNLRRHVSFSNSYALHALRFCVSTDYNSLVVLFTILSNSNAFVEHFLYTDSC